MAMKRFDPKEFLERAGEGRVVTGYRAGQSIFKQGTADEHVYYLQLGKAKETIITERGKQAVVDVIEPGSFFGTNSFDNGLPRYSTVTAMTPCTITVFTAIGMRHALRIPAFVDHFVNCLIAHNRDIEAEKIALLFSGSEKRLAQKLLMLSNWGDGAPREIGSEITQVMLAEMIGSTRTHVNRFLNKFRRLGLIRYDQGITVMPALLTAVLQEDVK